MNDGNWTRRDWVMGCSTAGLAAVCTNRSHAADADEVTAERLKVLRTCESLAADFRYYGEQDKPFYQITYSFGEAAERAAENSFHLVSKLDRAALDKLLDSLAKDGFLAAASDISTKDIQPQQGYSLTLTAKKKGAAAEFKRLGWQGIKGDGHVELYQPFGWDLKMIKRLEGLQPAVSGQAAKDMQILLVRLSGLKREWEKGR